MAAISVKRSIYKENTKDIKEVLIGNQMNNYLLLHP